MGIKYDSIGKNYNSTRKADPVLVDKLMGHLKPAEDGEYLDVGCGTGNYTAAIHNRGVSMTGVDPSKKMLDMAMRQNKAIKWLSASVENLPFTDHEFEGAIGTLTIHHWSNLQEGCNEIFRVLKPGGRLILFSSTPRQMAGYWLNHYFPKMLKDSMTQMPTYETVHDCLSTSGFKTIGTENYAIHPELEDLFLYSGKHDPSMYMNDQVRNGISSFSALANQKEVALGLESLRNDIQSGKIEEIKGKFSHNDGDYLFITALK